MAEVDWGNEANDAPKAKKRVPTWAWFCGGGCLLAVIAAVAVALFFGSKVSNMMDQDKQAAELRAELPFDELPEGTQIIGTGEFASMAPGIEDAWTLHMRDGAQVQISKFTRKGAAEMREGIKSGDLGDGAKQTFGPFGIFGIQNGEVDVQGRTLSWLRFQTFDPDASGAESKKDESSDEESEDKKPVGFRQAMSQAMRQRTMLIDITKEGDSGGLIVQYQQLGDGPPIDPNEVVEFLAPFHIGPNR